MEFVSFAAAASGAGYIYRLASPCDQQAFLLVCAQQSRNLLQNTIIWYRFLSKFQVDLFRNCSKLLFGTAGFRKNQFFSQHRLLYLDDGNGIANEAIARGRGA